MANCYSLCLSPDLKQIYFGWSSDTKKDVDLYMATRDSVDSPFGEPVLIESTVSPETDGYPAISPDGLELFFLRSDVKPMIWVTRRPDQASPFGPPEKWSVCEVGDSTSRIGTPQVLSADQVLFSRLDSEKGKREIWCCRRISGTQFSDPELFANPRGNPTAFFNVDGLRAYYGAEGLMMMWRSNIGAPFSDPDRLVEGAATGPFDGTFWVAPQEDVLFYCSPGPGMPLGSGRKFWVIGF
jgi:hypothetical protein